MNDDPRIVVHFSCGAASAVAAKLALTKYPTDRVHIVNVFIVEEHEDNRRFLTDCEPWFEKSVTVLRDEKYGASTIQVWTKKRFLSAMRAPCSRVLKRDVLHKWGNSTDVWVLGYTVEEQARADRIEVLYPDRQFLFPLIEYNLTKSDCLAMIERAGILLPMMYRMGYDNANCIGCPKGGAGYWNKIRRDFPERFQQIAALQESIGRDSGMFLRDRRTNEYIQLRDLSPGRRRADLRRTKFYVFVLL